MSKTLAIIPARVGSRGIPNKNFRSLAGGESAVERAIACAREILQPSEIVVTTDAPIDLFPHTSALYAPAPLHTDTCSMVDVVLDVLKRMPGPSDEIILLLQPTQPLRRPRHLRIAIATIENGSDSAASVLETEPAAKLYFMASDGTFDPLMGHPVERRQDARLTYKCDGTFYAFRRGWFLRHRSFRSGQTKMIVIPSHESCALDTLEDWKKAEFLVGAAS